MVRPSLSGTPHGTHPANPPNRCNNPWTTSSSTPDTTTPIAIDFAIIADDATSAQYAEYPDLQLYPFGAAPVAIVHNVANLTSQLVLSRAVLARIFRQCSSSANLTQCAPGNISSWSDPEILALNPTQTAALTAAGDIRVTVRADSAGVTSAVKRALANFDPVFAAQVTPPSSTPTTLESATWSYVDTFQVYGLLAQAYSLLDAASLPPNTAAVSYLPLYLAQSLNVSIAALVDQTANATWTPSLAQPTQPLVVPDAGSATRAALENALNYESPASHRVLDFTAATNLGAWPLVMTTYIAVRLEYLRPGATCQTRASLYQFMYLLLDPTENTTVDYIGSLTGVVRLPLAARLDQLANISAALQCDGYYPPSFLPVDNSTTGNASTIPVVSAIQFQVPQGMETVMTTLTQQLASLSVASDTDATTADINYAWQSATTLPNTYALPDLVAYDATFAGRSATVYLLPSTDETVQSALPADPGSAFTRVPFAAVPFAVRLNWCGTTTTSTGACAAYNPLQPTVVNETSALDWHRLQLPAALLAQIFSGAVTLWNDSAIAALNPELASRLPNATIVPIWPPLGPWSDLLADLLGLPPATISAVLAPSTIVAGNVEIQRAQLYSTLYSLAIVPGVSDQVFVDDQQTWVVADGHGLIPTITSVTACVTAPDAYDVALSAFVPKSAAQTLSTCYELVAVLDLFFPNTFESELACTDAVSALDESFIVAHSSGLPGAGFAPAPVRNPNTLPNALLNALGLILDAGVAYATPSAALEGARYDFEHGVSRATAIDVFVAALGSIFVVPLFNAEDVVPASALTSSQESTVRLTRATALQTVTCDTVVATNQLEDTTTVPSTLIYGLAYVLVGVSIALYLFLSIWVRLHHHLHVVRFASPVFLQLILAGAALMNLSLIPLSMNDAGFTRTVGFTAAELARLDVACQATPWLYVIGFAICFSSLFFKTMRLVVFFNNPRMRRYTHMRDINILYMVSGVVFVFAFVLVVDIVAAFPVYWDRVPLTLTSDGLTVTSSVGICTVYGDVWSAVLPPLVLMVLLLVFGLVMCYRARNLPVEFDETRWIALALTVNFQSLLFAIPVLDFTSTNATAAFITKCIIVFLNSTGTVALLFFPKLWLLYMWRIGASSSTGNLGGKVHRIQNDDPNMPQHRVPTPLAGVAHTQQHASGEHDSASHVASMRFNFGGAHGGGSGAARTPTGSHVGFFPPSTRSRQGSVTTGPVVGGSGRGVRGTSFNGPDTPAAYIEQTTPHASDYDLVNPVDGNVGPFIYHNPILEKQHTTGDAGSSKEDSENRKSARDPAAVSAASGVASFLVRYGWFRGESAAKADHSGSTTTANPTPGAGGNRSGGSGGDKADSPKTLSDVAANGVTSRGVQLLLDDPNALAKLRAALSRGLRDEGLRFVEAVLERDTKAGPERAAFTRKLVRDFILVKSPRAVNVSSAVRETLLKALSADTPTGIDDALADAALRRAALDATREIERTPEFQKFIAGLGGS